MKAIRCINTRGRCGIGYIEWRETSLVCLLVVNAVEEIDIELCFSVHLYV